ncbi:unnamed protein product [Callosobruchus maculatus]|uniref:CD80-like immunoglobulin C2-set domain-containing protein n=1 Tax=Callosobruchus maculatus TaxID=64391 RepID=A0A653CCT5_CALMS|nr:unnamed protein product [Callosobruchus maculatus]
MNISWYINDAEILPSLTNGIQIRTTLYRLPTDTTNDMLRVRSVLTARVTQALFRAGKLRLRCTATVDPLYKESDDREIQEDAPQLALIMVSTARSYNGTNLSATVCHSKLLIVILLIIQTSYWRWIGVISSTDNR